MQNKKWDCSAVRYNPASYLPNAFLVEKGLQGTARIDTNIQYIKSKYSPSAKFHFHEDLVTESNNSAPLAHSEMKLCVH